MRLGLFARIRVALQQVFGLHDYVWWYTHIVHTCIDLYMSTYWT